MKNGNRATAENAESNRRDRREAAKGAEGDKKRKEVMKIGSWEDGGRGILPVCLRQGFLGIYHLGIWNLFLITCFL